MPESESSCLSFSIAERGNRARGASLRQRDANVSRHHDRRLAFSSPTGRKERSIRLAWPTVSFAVWERIGCVKRGRRRAVCHRGLSGGMAVAVGRIKWTIRPGKTRACPVRSDSAKEPNPRGITPAGTAKVGGKRLPQIPPGFLPAPPHRPWRCPRIPCFSGGEFYPRHSCASFRATSCRNCSPMWWLLGQPGLGDFQGVKIVVDDQDRDHASFPASVGVAWPF